MAIKKELLKKLIPLNRMDEETLDRLGETATTIKANRGERLYEGPSDSDHSYYLLAGQLHLTDDAGKAHRLKATDELARYPFGPDTALSRSAKIESDNTMLIRFDRSLLYALILRRFSPLGQLNEQTLQQLAHRSQFLNLAQNEKIYLIGSEDDHLYYLLQGSIRMTDRQAKAAHLDSESEQARFAFGSLKPRPANAKVDSSRALVARFNSRELDTTITWHDMVGQQQEQEPDLSDISALGFEEIDMVEYTPVDTEWLMALLRSHTFYKVPPENVQLLAEKMEPVTVSAGDEVIRQGDPGDYYYVVRTGRCEVIHNGVKVDEMGPTEGFGEEALISGNPRNSTIRMTEDGVLMRLSKADFDQLLAPPLINRVNVQEATKMALEGAILIDVRSREEYKHQRLVRSINLPLNLLRIKLKKLKPNRDKIFIVYCDTGVRSSAASFLLKQEGYNVYLLDNPHQAFKVLSARSGEHA